MKRLFLFLIILFYSCGSEVQTLPKPRTYPRVQFPDKTYQSFSQTFCDLTFEMPVYATIEQDNYFFGAEPIHPCWFDVVFPSFNGRIHCSYYPIENSLKLEELITDSYELLNKHRIKANFIKESRIKNINQNAGMLFQLSGSVASPLQFYLTDSSSHFLRGALYFNNKINPDSMAIIHQFVFDDVQKILESFAWQKKE